MESAGYAAKLRGLCKAITRFEDAMAISEAPGQLADAKAGGEHVASGEAMGKKWRLKRRKQRVQPTLKVYRKGLAMANGIGPRRGS